MKTFGFAAILTTMCALAACSGDDGARDAGGPGGADGQGGASGATVSIAVSSTAGEGGAAGVEGEGGAGGGSECAGATGDACTECCIDAHRAGAGALLALTIGFCGCEAGAPCAATCDTADEATDACVEEGGVDVAALRDNAECMECMAALSADAACYASSGDDCMQSEECEAFVLCSSGCSGS
ncbi:MULTISPECIES: hypothetical protein [Sorangium]|uniref:Secreted protein n=1 Tax=Sorangium cellulosum (strain So ce56) TaxID=448385 RepID=A9GKA9_SORC5|nr:hypothetical protein [Sorangium cellulosum]CAN96558.1 putative secreted protein [Sorangium cellulosum So ce56]